MTGIQIKIAGEWVELPEDFSISLEQSSPLFNDQGTFSFPFEIPLEPNRKIFKGVDDPFHDITLGDIDKTEAELWFNGVMLYRGIIETDEEVEFEDTIPVTFLSGNSDFMSRIENMNARDVPLDRDIKLGYVVTDAMLNKLVEVRDGEFRRATYDLSLPDFVMMNYTEYNVSDPYPISSFCNVRVCASNENGYYKVLEAKRPYSGVCFYVLYLIDCLFKYLDITVTRNDLPDVEDMCRLAFFSTQCHARLGEIGYQMFLEDISRKDFCGNIYELELTFDLAYYYGGLSQREKGLKATSSDFQYTARDVLATKENFPDVQLDDLLSDLSTAFGIRMIYDSMTNTIRLVYVRDILKEQNIGTLDVDILSAVLKRDKQGDIRLTYGQSDNISFDYTDFTNVKEYDNYESVLSAGINQYDTTCKVDRQTGNAYRIKVNKETGNAPVLFEVAGFHDYIQKSGSNGEEQEQSISFNPVIINAISVQEKEDGSYVPVANRQPDSEHRASLSRSDTKPSDVAPPEEVLAIFADVTLKQDVVYDIETEFSERTYQSAYDSLWGESRTFPMKWRLKALCPEMYDTESDDEPPLRSYDAGYTLGIMRGPGNDSGVETTASNYDGEGNDSWVQTVGSYAFTSDSCDMYGRFFDYNGTEEGGADQSGRFSLKLVAEKDGYPIGDNYKGRGLVAKFLSEYLYFMAHKKTVTLTVRMSITQITGIDFLKRYRIGNYVGFINKVSYTLTNYGIEDVAVEIYVL